MNRKRGVRREVDLVHLFLRKTDGPIELVIEDNPGLRSGRYVLCGEGQESIRAYKHERENRTFSRVFCHPVP